ncbi:MAG: hypothetical protein KJO33_05110 [Gammaproteobacteria bacterium]|nr:hypothetical protein [Gammaproteobacteria bacterium]
MIAESCDGAREDSELRELLAAVAESRGAEAGPDDLEQGCRFVVTYIEQVPYMMKVAWTAASNVGLEAEMARILERVNSYWIEGNDIIPDELGVVGLLDDAYCSLTSLQSVSDHYRLQTGKYLFPDDLSLSNKAMRRIIGEPYASDLDRLVIGTMTEAGLIDAVKMLASEEKRLDFEHNSTIWSHGPAGEMELEDLKKLGIL